MARPRNAPKPGADPDNAAIALAIGRRMDALKLQGADLGEALRNAKTGEPMSGGQVSRILSGETTLNTKQLKRICILLRTTRAELLTEAETPPSDDDLALRLYLSGLSPEAKRSLLSFVNDKRA